MQIKILTHIKTSLGDSVSWNLYLNQFKFIQGFKKIVLNENSITVSGLVSLTHVYHFITLENLNLSQSRHTFI